MYLLLGLGVVVEHARAGETGVLDALLPVARHISDSIDVLVVARIGQLPLVVARYHPTMQKQ